MKKLLTLALAALALAACQEAPQTQVYPPITFSDQLPYRLNVAEVRMEDARQTTASNMEGQLPVTPYNALSQWVRDRLQTAGSTGIMVITVEDAMVRETPLAKTDGVKGFFTDDQDARYDGRVAVTLKLYDGVDTMAKAQANVVVARSRTINEKATLAQREKFYYELVEDVMRQFDREADARIRQYFSNHMRY